MVNDFFYVFNGLVSNIDKLVCIYTNFHSLFEIEYLPYFSKMVSSNRLIIKTYFSFGNSNLKNFFVFCSLDSNPKPYRL